MFPRGGGVWDQDPILMRDFREIRKAEVEWKEVNERMEEFNTGSGGAQDVMAKYLSELGEDGTF